MVQNFQLFSRVLRNSSTMPRLGFCEEQLLTPPESQLLKNIYVMIKGNNSATVVLNYRPLLGTSAPNIYSTHVLINARFAKKFLK